MAREKIGRNDPCPCGSGRKYKRCCGSAEGAGVAETSSGALHPTTEALRDLLQGRDFDSLEAMQAELDRAAAAIGATPEDDFHGLTPDQMHDLLYAPFDSPATARFAERLAMPADAPATILFTTLVEAIGENGAKATAKGNLPGAVCKPVAAACLDRLDPESHRLRLFSRPREDDFEPLHVTRLVAGLAGLVIKRGGRFQVTKKCRSLMAEEGMPRLYPLLLRTFIEKFNWGYSDGYPELPFIQRSFLFTLYLLHRYGDRPRPTTFYQEAYLQAFPALLAEAPGDRYASPEQIVAHSYSLRTFDRFTTFFGLTGRRYEKGSVIDPFRSIVRKSALLDEWVRFDPQP